MLLNKMQYIQHSYSVKESSRKYYTNIIRGEYFRRLSNKKWIVYTRRLTSQQTNQFNQKCNQKIKNAIKINQTEMKVISEILCDLESKESNHKYYTERNVMKDIREWAPKFKNTLQAHEESDHLYDEIVLKQIIQYHQFLLNYRKKVRDEKFSCKELLYYTVGVMGLP